MKTKRNFCKGWDREKVVFFVFPSMVKMIQYHFCSVCVNHYIYHLFVNFFPPSSLSFIFYSCSLIVDCTCGVRIITNAFIGKNDSIVDLLYMKKLNFRTINHWHMNFVIDCVFTSTFKCVDVRKQGSESTANASLDRNLKKESDNHFVVFLDYYEDYIPWDSTIPKV